jgi:hypothetical protein
MELFLTNIIISYKRKNRDRGYLRTGCWGEYSDLRERKQHVGGKNFILISFITCILHQLFLGQLNKKRWDGQGVQHTWKR